jgi:3-oxoacyl-[acyl-carrier-protein] synthase II
MVKGMGAIFPAGYRQPTLSDGQQAAIADDDQALKRLLDRRGFRYKDAATRLAAAASLLALRDAGWLGSTVEPINDPDFGVVAASCFGNADTVLDSFDVLRRETVQGLSPMNLPNASPNVVASTLALWFGAKGPNLFFAQGPTSGLDSLMIGARLIRAKRATRVLVCAAESEQPRLSDWLRSHGESAPFSHAVALALAASAGETGIAIEPGGAPSLAEVVHVQPTLLPSSEGGFHSTTGLLLAIEQLVRLRQGAAQTLDVSMFPRNGHGARLVLRSVTSS